MVIPLGSKFILALREDEERRIRIMDDLERRVKRLELLMLNEAEDKIADLQGGQAGSIEKLERIMLKEAENEIATFRDEQAGSVLGPIGVKWTDMVLPIEEIIKKRANAAHTGRVH